MMLKKGGREGGVGEKREGGKGGRERGKERKVRFRFINSYP